MLFGVKDVFQLKILCEEYFCGLLMSFDIEVEYFILILIIFLLQILSQITKKWEYALSKEIPQDLNSVSELHFYVNFIDCFQYAVL